MRIDIRSRGLTLTKKQTLQLQHDLGNVFARFGERIVRVIVTASASDDIGLTSCELEVQLKPKPITVVCSDRDVFVAVGYAAKRAARSVSRAIDLEGLTHG
jgi:hypothetical protein